MTIPGIGAIVASALVAAIGSPGRSCSAGNRFKSRRYAWAGRGSFGRKRKHRSCKRGLREGDDEMA
jgi:hypothetical protein